MARLSKVDEPIQEQLPEEEIVIAQCYRYSCHAYRTKNGRWVSLDDNAELLDVVKYYRI